MSKADQKRSYRHLLQAVRDVIRRHDPAHLMRMGAPRDEYDLEVAKILPALKNQRSPEDLVELLHAMFSGPLDPEPAEPARNYAEAAAEIWSIWEKYRSTGVVEGADTGVTLEDLEHVVASFVRGDMDYWALHQRFMDKWLEMPDAELAGPTALPWDEVYELIYMGAPDPIPPEDRNVGVIGEAELRVLLAQALAQRSDDTLP